MKNRKWLTYTLGILLTLAVLAVVGAVGFRLGTMQNASFTSVFRKILTVDPSPCRGTSKTMTCLCECKRTSTKTVDIKACKETLTTRDSTSAEIIAAVTVLAAAYPSFAPIFGLIHLALLGLLIWVVYKLVKNSGWRLTRVAASPAPAVSETPRWERGSRGEERIRVKNPIDQDQASASKEADAFLFAERQ